MNWVNQELFLFIICCILFVFWIIEANQVHRFLKLKDGWEDLAMRYKATTERGQKLLKKSYDDYAELAEELRKLREDK